MCGALRPSDAGDKAVLIGWVNRRRDLGSIIFLDLRDRTGVTQVVLNRELNPSAHQKAEQLRNEYVIAVTGKVKRRDSDTINKNIPTGEVELMVDELRVLNESKQPPFLPSETVLPNEEMRLKYRYIDLRREPMQFNIEMRHKVSKAIRDYLVWNSARFWMDAKHLVSLIDTIDIIPGKKENYGSAVYAHGVSDFSQMLFLAHLLRTDDLFLDVGANAGMYSVLGERCYRRQSDRI